VLAQACQKGLAVGLADTGGVVVARRGVQADGSCPRSPEGRAAPQSGRRRLNPPNRGKSPLVLIGSGRPETGPLLTGYRAGRESSGAARPRPSGSSWLAAVACRRSCQRVRRSTRPTGAAPSWVWPPLGGLSPSVTQADRREGPVGRDGSADLWVRKPAPRRVGAPKMAPGRYIRPSQRRDERFEAFVGQQSGSRRALSSYALAVSAQQLRCRRHERL
jgi:hypothetical protein